MKKHDLRSLLSLLASPVLLMLLGVILLFNPDSAPALVSRVLGWCIFLAGIGFGVSAMVRSSGTAWKVIAAIACLSLGGWLIRHPLAMAAGIGRLLGILLLIRGGRDIFQKNGGLWGLVTAVLGLVLILLPMTTSRLVFSACGLVMAAAGVLMLLDRLRRRRLEPGEPDDPNIIDAL